MRIADTRTPVVVLHCGLGGLAVMRSLGKLGVKVVGVIDNSNAVATQSRYCTKAYYHKLTDIDAVDLTSFLVDIARDLDRQPILIAMSDETAIYIAENCAHLRDHFLIGQACGSLVADLANKKSMFELATRHGLPVPKTVMPTSLDDLREQQRQFTFPVMLKGAMGNKLKRRTGKKMVVAHDPDELVALYNELQDPDEPNLMIQELIPGADDQVFIFNGYFNENSECLASFTGRKIRQDPIHQGIASMGECCTVDEVMTLTTTFLAKVGYRGVVDIGYRKDPRDGTYKVLDINPRVGQAFRIFVAHSGMDVVRAMYLDLTNQAIVEPVEPIEGRRWVIEDCDFFSALDNQREGLLKLGEWVRSFRRVEESAWFDLRDPLPPLIILSRFFARFVRWTGKKLAKPFVAVTAST